jgi:hypothetical protein
MGRTVATYHEAVAEEQTRLLAFRRSLRKEDQQLYDCLWEWARLHTQAGTYQSATSPFIPILFSILLESCRQVKDIEGRIAGLEERIQSLERGITTGEGG